MYLSYDSSKGRQKLTFREKEVFELRIQGYDRKQIASCLKISKSTVKKHLENIHLKLGVSSQVELMQLRIKK